MRWPRPAKVVLVLLAVLLGLASLSCLWMWHGLAGRRDFRLQGGDDGPGTPLQPGTESSAAPSPSLSITPSSSSSVTAVGSALPLRKPVELLRRTSNPWIFQPNLRDQYRLPEVSGTRSPDPNLLPTDAAIDTLDIATKKVAKLDAAKLQVPAFHERHLLAGLEPRRALPGSAAANSEPLLFWTTADAQHTGNGIPR